MHAYELYIQRSSDSLTLYYEVFECEQDTLSFPILREGFSWINLQSVFLHFTWCCEWVRIDSLQFDRLTNAIPPFFPPKNNGETKGVWLAFKKKNKA